MLHCRLSNYKKKGNKRVREGAAVERAGKRLRERERQRVKVGNKTLFADSFMAVTLQSRNK